MSRRKSFLLRLDQELWEELERWANDELRSVNAQIEYILKQAVLKRKGHTGAEKISAHIASKGETAINSSDRDEVKKSEALQFESTEDAQSHNQQDAQENLKPQKPEEEPQKKSTWVGFEDVPD